ncbi:PTS sugar transporter subunit IIA [Brachyspira aalborgi]|uniref:PTS sugar transporter subunit IIA n=1 Tax=Brachyspira aalborgi TaxID=29522 RepID=A0A5C8EMP3_9SPIR|nr:PTS sugar transporter subunit IIA [Brachyspira aalborgi]TXJ39259.1 PTS sugar transporter subunit IIA [Brachyspira aalborgi]
MKPALIVMSHGKFSNEIIESAKMILGNIEGYETVSMHNEEGFEITSKKLQKCIDKLDRNNILILVDLYGGTPFNIANIFLHKKNNIRLIAGMNLAMIIEYFSSNTEDLDVLVNEIIKAGKDNISIPMLEEYNNIELDE